MRFYDLLGVASGDDAAAAARWPASRVQGEVGVVTGDAPTLELVKYLQEALRFRAVRPGATGDRVGLTAEVVIANPPTSRPLVLTQMPDVAFHLQDTVGDPGTSGYRPARLYVTTGDTGTELVLEGLPVEIRLPSGLLGPLREPEFEEAHPEGGPDVTPTGTFESGVYDSVQVTLRDAEEFSSIWCHIRVRMTEEMDFIVEPGVPISIGECRFNGLPCHGLHDLALVPSPRLQDERPGEQALEWARHSINPFARWLDMAQWAGVLTVRTVDLNAFRPPLKELTDRLNEGRENNLKVEFVLSDVALPFFNLTGLPLPVHALFGLRRPIVAGDDADEAFNLTDPPIIRLGDYRVIVEQLLLRTPASLDPLDQFLFARLALLRGEDTAPNEGTGTVGVTDDWTLQFGWRYPEGRSLFTVADATVRFWGFKLGVSVGRWTSKTRYQWHEMLQALVDLQIDTKGTSVFDGAFKVQSLSGEDVQIVVRDLGWSLGTLSMDGLSFPEGIQFIAFDSFRLIVEEVAWTAEPNGASYFSVSGGIAFGMWGASRRPSSGNGTGALSEKSGADDKGGGVRFYRLRYRTGGNPDAPAVLLDGISVSIRWGRFALTGLGMVNEYTADGHEYKEFAIGLEIEFDALARHFLVGFQLFYGRVKGPAHNFRYWLFGVKLGFLPVSSFELQNVRVLAAGNLTPNLPPPDANAQEMRIFRWYKSSGDGAITLPANRRLGSWRPADESMALGMGARVSTAGTTVISCDLFCLGYGGPEGKGFLAALEVFLATSPKPIGFAALEWDIERDKVGFLAGVSLSVDNVLPEGVDLAFLEDLGSITGQLFIGNQPGTVAIGQLNDQSTWMSFRFGTNRILDCSVVVGICIHWVELPEGPKGFGLIFTAKGGSRFGIGMVQAYLTFGFIAGVWRNESAAAGFLGWIEAGVRIKVFWVFNFGASARIEFDYLGPAPAYRRLSCVLRIETPWWLPDATFRFEKIWDQPKPERLRAVSSPLVAAAAIDPGRLTEVPGLVTPIIGSAIDPRETFSIAQLVPLDEPALEDGGIQGLEPVGVDSVIALDFKPALDDATTTGENTPPGAGTEEATPPAVSDLAVTYELIETGIRRRPRFGPGAGVWTTLLAPEDTRLQTPADLPAPPDLAAHFESAVSFLWDKERLFKNRLDPRRLLVNARTPYTFVTGDAEADDVIVADQPGWPCCVPDRKRDHWHTLDFEGTAPGTRAPSTQRFTESNSSLHWTGAAPPVVAPGLAAPGGIPAARVRLAGRGAGTLATVSLDRAAFVLEIYGYWLAHASLGALVVDAYDGLVRVASHTFPFGAAGPPAPIRLQRREGMTSIVLRIVGGRGVPIAGHLLQGTGWLEVARLRYRTVREELDRVAWEQKCRRQGEHALDGGGRLAWLPNHDYEISLTTKVTLAHQRSGAQQAVVRQKAGFRTRGLPGLNAVARIGDEVEAYVESRYPGPAPRTLYRSESVHLAFDERFNILVPVDRAPSPDNPDELNQMLEWVLAVERTGSPVGNERVSQTSPDWVVAHRPLPLPPGPRRPRVLDGVLAPDLIRRATTTDPFQVRFEALAHGPLGCGTVGPSLHKSQVLIHRPVDLGGDPAVAQLWERGNTYRVNLRRKLGPFVERSPFDKGDAPAFSPAVEGGGSPGAWTSADGTMRLVGAPSDGRRRYAVFGEDGWNHVQVRVAVDPEGGAAGVAVAVAGLPAVSQAAIALVDEAAGRLVLLERRSDSVTEVASELLPAGADAPYLLEVTAFDDRLRASVGETTLEVARVELREGRLALVAQDGGAFQSLMVEALDAYRFEFRSSHYATFEEHIGSFDGVVDEVPVEGSTPVAALVAATTGNIAEVMARGADPLARQAVFDRWVTGLALPLRQDPTGLSLSRVTSSQGTDLLVLESPEPLPFSDDVTLALMHQQPAPPQPPHWPGWLGDLVSWLRSGREWMRRPDAAATGAPPELVGVSRSLSFGGERVEGTILGRIPRNARKLVRLAERDGEPAYEVYDLSFQSRRRGGWRLTGKLTGSYGPPEGPVPGPRLGRGEIAILDHEGVLVAPVIPENPVIWVASPIRILSNASERVALIIPMGAPPATHAPLASGAYRLDFRLDRCRFRTETPDAVSNYRASVSVTVEV